MMQFKPKIRKKRILLIAKAAKLEFEVSDSQSFNLLFNFKIFGLDIEGCCEIVGKNCYEFEVSDPQ